MLFEAIAMTTAISWSAETADCVQLSNEVACGIDTIHYISGRNFMICPHVDTPQINSLITMSDEVL